MDRETQERLERYEEAVASSELEGIETPEWENKLFRRFILERRSTEEIIEYFKKMHGVD